jgi:hypothetical protein
LHPPQVQPPQCRGVLQPCQLEQQLLHCWPWLLYLRSCCRCRTCRCCWALLSLLHGCCPCPCLRPCCCVHGGAMSRAMSVFCRATHACPYPLPCWQLPAVLQPPRPARPCLPSPPETSLTSAGEAVAYRMHRPDPAINQTEILSAMPSLLVAP